MIIRDETPADHEAITDVTVEAFKTLEVSRQTEHFIIRALRRAGALSVSLVAELDGKVVGHIAMSPAKIAGRDCGWYGAGPLAVLPSLQRRGIGRRLMHEALAQLRAMDAGGCVLVGDPEYYKRFGFRHLPGLVFEHAPAENFMALPLRGDPVAGQVDFHEAFLAEE